MRFILLGSCSLLFWLNCNAQIKTYRYAFIFPNWDVNTTIAIKRQSILTDSVFLYKKKENNSDSILAMVEFYDSSGNLKERDEYSNNDKALWRITSFNYIDDLLLTKEIVSKPMFIINNVRVDKETRTYEYDSAGNLITEKLFSNAGDSLNKMSTTIWKREYDSSGNLIKEFEQLPSTDKSYLRKICFYVNGAIHETKIFDYQQNWVYSIIQEYDDESKKTSISMLNEKGKILNHEQFFDAKQRLIKENIYADGRIYWDHSTQTYLYSVNDLIEAQSYQDVAGNNYYFKHFYSTH